MAFSFIHYGTDPICHTTNLKLPSWAELSLTEMVNPALSRSSRSRYGTPSFSTAKIDVNDAFHILWSRMPVSRARMKMIRAERDDGVTDHLRAKVMAEKEKMKHFEIENS